MEYYLKVTMKDGSTVIKRAGRSGFLPSRIDLPSPEWPMSLDFTKPVRNAEDDPFAAFGFNRMPPVPTCVRTCPSYELAKADNQDKDANVAFTMQVGAEPANFEQGECRSGGVSYSRPDS
jgi:hypothetical protein